MGRRKCPAPHALPGISTIVVDAEVADVRLLTGPGADLRAKVVLDSRDDTRLPQCAKSELNARREGATLRLTLSQPGRKHCREAWSVEIPASIAVDAAVDVGSIDAVLNGSYGDVDVHANVGRAELKIDGRTVVPGNETGPSTTVPLKGDGPRLSLRSGVGNVRVAVGMRALRTSARALLHADGDIQRWRRDREPGLIPLRSSERAASVIGNPYGSLGIPRKFLSFLPLPFWSWNTAIQYWPRATPEELAGDVQRPLRFEYSRSRCESSSV